VRVSQIFVGAVDKCRLCLSQPEQSSSCCQSVMCLFFDGAVHLKKAMVALSLCLTSGCVGFYQQPHAEAPHATLEAIQGVNTMLDGGVQQYWAYYDVACTDTSETGVLGVRKGEATEQFLLIPDRRIFVQMMSTGGSKKDGVVTLRNCINVSSFVPAAGQTYQIVQTVPSRGCLMEIFEKNTGLPPPSFVREEVKKGCGR